MSLLGEQGTGKSHVGKFLRLGVAAADRQAVMATLQPGVIEAQVVRLGDTAVCVDPLRSPAGGRQ